jgi:hypothetical protein
MTRFGLRITTVMVGSRLTLALIIMCMAALNVSGAEAQATQKKETVPKGPSMASTTQLQGELVAVGPNWLIARMVPSGGYRLFDVRPGATATIDNVKKSLSQLKPGTMLTAAVTVTETPLARRTTTVTKGRLIWSSPTTIVVTLENGENRQYTVPSGFKFNVDGKQLGVDELRTGMLLTGTNIVEEPATLITEQTVVFGTEPKK